MLVSKLQKFCRQPLWFLNSLPVPLSGIEDGAFRDERRVHIGGSRRGTASLDLPQAITYRVLRASEAPCAQGT